MVDGLAPFGDDRVMAVLLHKVVEDIDFTAERLLDSVIPLRFVDDERIRQIAADSSATL
ncbi:hypothetical protein [Streptomyces zhihengii]|uniref:hypothetical protein n=1 Tax=Streptomyces zhihengii TaxID=1818004 RepID=UPI0033AFBEBD